MQTLINIHNWKIHYLEEQMGRGSACGHDTVCHPFILQARGTLIGSESISKLLTSLPGGPGSPGDPGIPSAPGLPLSPLGPAGPIIGCASLE